MSDTEGSPKNLNKSDPIFLSSDKEAATRSGEELIFERFNLYFDPLFREE